MIIDKFTIAVLKNFASINPVLLIREGNILTTGIPDIIKASATLDISFPKRFALDNVAKFINVLEMFKDPSIDFLDNMLIISSGIHSFKIMYTEESIIEELIVPDRQIILPSIDVQFTLHKENLDSVKKALKILGLSEIHFIGDGEAIYIRAANSENPTSDYFSIRLGNFDKKFCVVFKAEYFDLFPDIYRVEICKKGIARFDGFNKLEYFITMNNNVSYFE